MHALQLFVSVFLVVFAVSTCFCACTCIAVFVSSVVDITLPERNAVERRRVAARVQSLESDRIEIMRRRGRCFTEYRKDSSDYSNMSKYNECVDKCYTHAIILDV